MILTKKDFKKFGFKNVIECGSHPIMIIAGTTFSAKTFRFKTLQELHEQPWFSEALSMQTPILLYPDSQFVDNPAIYAFRMFFREDVYKIEPIHILESISYE